MVGKKGEERNVKEFGNCRLRKAPVVNKGRTEKRAVNNTPKEENIEKKKQ